MVAVRVKRTHLYRTYSTLTWERHATRMPYSFVLPLLRFCLSILVRHFVNLILDENENVSLDTERSKQTKHMVLIEIYERIKKIKREKQQSTKSKRIIHITYVYVYGGASIKSFRSFIFAQYHCAYENRSMHCCAIQSNSIWNAATRNKEEKNEKQHFELLKMFWKSIVLCAPSSHRHHCNIQAASAP